MIGYRCYFLDDQDHIQSAEDIVVEALDEAIDRALAWLPERRRCVSIEIWQGPLRVYASREELPRHQCHIYEGAPSKTLQTMALIIDRKLKANIRCLYLNSPTMVAGLRSFLASTGVDVEREVARGALDLSCDQGHLRDGRFAAAAMLKMLEDAVAAALADGYAGLWAAGDMAWELGSERDPQQLLDYEWGLEEIFRRRPQLSGVCQYHADILPPDVVRHGLAAHRSALVNETISRINPHYLAPASRKAPHNALAEMVEDLCEARDRAR